MTHTYVYAIEVPSVADYCRLRIAAGLSARSPAAAAAGLPNTVVGVVVRCGDEAIAMGRVIGDGLFYQIVDMAVVPDHQGQGIGKAVMAALMAELQRVAPAEAYVSLIADGDARHLYARYGFEETAPASVGMARWIGR